MFQQIVASGFGTGGFDRGFSEIDLCRLAIRAAKFGPDADWLFGGELTWGKKLFEKHKSSQILSSLFLEALALRVNADCMRDIQDAQSEWAQEKPAIEQEVARDLSNPTYKFTTRLNEDIFSGTVYSHDALGTKGSFDATTGDMLKDFYKK
jgi:hypothetical protein